jgi:hypothetical protein
MGIPLPAGAVQSAQDLRLEVGGAQRSIQAHALDRWPDGSIRWVLVDFRADAEPTAALPMNLLVASADDVPHVSASDSARVHVSKAGHDVEVATSRAVFKFTRGGPFPLSAVIVDGEDATDPAESRFRISLAGRTIDLVIDDVTIYQDGPLRAEIDLRARAQHASTLLPLEVHARVEIFAGSATARVELTIRNTRRARHAGGQWPLGDPGSVYFDSARLTLATRRAIDSMQAAVEFGEPLQPFGLPFELHQESSGGEFWDGPVHRNRNGVVPHRYCGYRVSAADAQRTGRRASPIVVLQAGRVAIAAAVPQFWENFPQSIAVRTRALDIGFFPPGTSDKHELQGGEQKAHRIVLAFETDRVSDPPLAWCHDPSLIAATPEWSCRTAALPFLVPVSGHSESRHLALTGLALDPAQGFFAKRERFDEFGWRHFGDLPADHESAFRTDPRPFVSHYNNQYDAVGGFGLHYLRSGDRRWWRLMDDLARHVRDIDIYRTTEDKAAYNGGLFWHTYHYVDAGTSTHRTYPTGIAAGGGPSAEHNYASGLMLHYFLTGERASREAVIGLARWVLDMDDGRQSPFRWLASGPTGLASATGSPDYHGPGRGAANSIVVCRSAYRLTGDRVFATKADELIRRCIHPRDDLRARNLLDVERRWYYTVFLQALGVYLHEKQESGELDEMYDYAQASLLHYARWMVDHERPYLERPDVLEYPTETWVAQDVRKADVFWWAALHADEEERPTFLGRATDFFEYSMGTLSGMPTRVFTRPVVLLLTNGLRADWFRLRYVPTEPKRAPQEYDHRPSPAFRPQKRVALDRSRWIAMAIAAATLVALIALL